MSGEEGAASRRASTGASTGHKPAPTRTGAALLGSLGALSSSSGGLDFTKKKEHEADKKDNESTGSGEKKGGAGGNAVSKFSAAKLVSIVQETSAPSLARLRKNIGDSKGDLDHSRQDDGDEHPPSEGGEISGDSASRRRTPARSMSAQNPRTNNRKLRMSEHNLDSTLGGDDYDDASAMEGSTMDRSVASSASSSRRRLPQRSRSAVEGVSSRSQSGEARPPRGGRRRPERVEEEEEGAPISPRKSRPTRAKSAEEIPRAYQQRRARGGRRKPGREEDSDSDGVDYSDAEESVEISDSDAEAEREDIDRSTASHSGRRRAPGRSKSVQDTSLARGNSERYDRAERRRARRRGTNGEGDEDEGSPKRGAPQRANTGDGPARGPALRRTNTGDGPGPRSARSRVARNTAAELAVVASRQREQQEREYSPESPVAERSGHGAKGSVSPIKSREERRRMREAKEREGMERRMTMGSSIPDKPKKKEEPWMRRRLQKASGEDSFTFDDAFSATDGFMTNHDSAGRGSSLPRFDQGDDFFQDGGFSQSTTPTIPKLNKPPK